MTNRNHELLDNSQLQEDYPEDSPFNSHIFTVLSSRYCRYVLYYFMISSESATSLETLVKEVQNLATQTDHPAVGTERELRSRLVNQVLPQLAFIEAVEYDPRTETVRHHRQPTLDEYAQHSAYQELPSDVATDI